MPFEKGKPPANKGKVRVKGEDGKIRLVDPTPEPKNDTAIPLKQVEFPGETLYFYLKRWRAACQQLQFDCRQCPFKKFCGPSFDKLVEKINKGDPNVVSGKSKG